MTVYDLIVIGGGASGLTAAITAYRRNKNVLVLEREQKLGAKILVTGNGKCNLSATDVCPNKYNRPDFVRDIIEKEDVGGFFRSLGVMTKKADKRIYPYSESALTVVSKLRAALPENAICFHEVKNITKKGDLLYANEYVGKNVALCTGSAATRGKASYDLLSPFGHNVTPLRPALVPLLCDTEFIKGLSGLRAKARLRLLCDKKVVATEEGEILFKDGGVSGIAAMCISSYIARHPDKYALSVDFVSESKEEVAPFLVGGKADGVLHKAVAQAVERYAERKGVPLLDALTDFRLNNVRCGPLSQAQVMCGGLKTEEFDHNLQSKLAPGLYVGGEALDIDGECGGYNLHWAFASGMRIGRSI